MYYSHMYPVFSSVLLSPDIKYIIFLWCDDNVIETEN